MRALSMRSRRANWRASPLRCARGGGTAKGAQADNKLGPTDGGDRSARVPHVEARFHPQQYVGAARLFDHLPGTESDALDLVTGHRPMRQGTCQPGTGAVAALT